MINNEIAVLIPCYNEESNISKVIQDFQKQIPNATIYVYDNNSTDFTKPIADLHNVQTKRVETNGKGATIRQMLKEIDADTYIIVDGNDRYRAEDAKEMIFHIATGINDMVLGNRIDCPYSIKKSQINKALNKKYGTNIEDALTGFRALSKKAAKEMIITFDEFEVDLEMTIFGLKNNWIINQVIVSYDYSNVKKLSTFKALKCLSALK